MLKTFAGNARLTLVCADMLDVSVDDLAGQGMNKLVSNLPYSVGSRVLVNLMMSVKPPEIMVVTVQLEVAQRLAAAPSGNDYGMLSVWAQAGYDVEIVKKVSPSCFWPMPEVTSAVVRLSRHERYPLTAAQRKLFYGLTKQVFAHRRKQLSTSLARVDVVEGMNPKRATDLLAGIGVEGKARPENLGVEEWCALVKAMEQTS